MIHDACQATEAAKLEKKRSLAIPFEAHQNDRVFWGVLNADLVIRCLEEGMKQKMTLGQKLGRWKTVVDYGLDAVDVVVPDTMLFCQGFSVQQGPEMKKAALTTPCHL